MALGALDAMREAARAIPIVGVNATPDGVAAIKAGELLASAALDAMKLACLGVEAALRALAGERVRAEILLPVAVAERANCCAWDLPYTERALPDWRSACGAKGAPTATPELEIVAAHNFPLRRTTRVGKLWAVSRLRGEAPRK